MLKGIPLCAAHRPGTAATLLSGHADYFETEPIESGMQSDLYEITACTFGGRLVHRCAFTSKTSDQSRLSNLAQTG
jgi:hypothetical protein